MKSLLITTGAAVAAITTVAGAAHAADPIKLSIGGFGAFAVGMATQDGDYTNNTSTTGAGIGPGAGDSQGWDVKGNNEVFFTGATTLDNGLDVSVTYELEAGGRDGGDAADTWTISVGSRYGTLLVGATDAATTLIAKGHADVSGPVNGFDEGDALSGLWVAAPAAVTLLDATFINTAGDAEKLTYVSPSFSGFTVTATAVPSLDDTNGDTASMPASTAAEDVMAVGAMWEGTASGATIGLEGGYLTADTANDSHGEWQAGATISAAGFTLGGAYRQQDVDQAGVNAVGDDRQANAWELGVAYETGPYGVSLGYFKSTAENLNNAGTAVVEDEVAMWQVSGSYAMGPGIDLKLSGGVIAFDDASTDSLPTAANFDNDGTYMMTGLSLAF